MSTYEITGDESGVVIGTLGVYGNGRYVNRGAANRVSTTSSCGTETAAAIRAAARPLT